MQTYAILYSQLRCEWYSPLLFSFIILHSWSHLKWSHPDLNIIDVHECRLKCYPDWWPLLIRTSPGCITATHWSLIVQPVLVMSRYRWESVVFESVNKVLDDWFNQFLPSLLIEEVIWKKKYSWIFGSHYCSIYCSW